MALGVNIVSDFNAKGIEKAIKDFKKLKTGTDKMGFSLKTADAAVTNGIKNFAKYGAVIGGVAAVVGGSLVKAALESQRVSKQTEAIIKATGSAAGMTTKEIQDLATSISLKTGIDDEAIQSSMNLLLTFKQVRNETGKGNDIFNRATQAAVDLGNVFGSTDSAAKQLGKALSDPIKGVGALARSGINFSAQQKEQIKTLVESGRVLDAQKIILGEVETQVGGTAEATGTSFDKMKVAIGNVQEELGMLLLPAFEKLTGYITDKIIPKVKEFADIVGKKGLGEALKYLAGESTNALEKLGKWGNVIYGIVTAIVALKVATIAFTVAEGLATIAVAAFGVAWNASGIGLIAAGIALIVVALVAAYIKFEAFRNVLNTVFKFIKMGVTGSIDLIKGYFTTLLGFYKGIFNGIAKLWNNTIGKLSFKAPKWVPKFGGKGFDVPDIPMLAEGGIVTKPTLAMIGEAGSEAVIPLSKMNRMGGGVNITIQTGVGDPVAIGREVQKVLNANARRVA